MAHNLATLDGRVAMAYDGATPWHSLGTPLRKLLEQATPATYIDVALDAASMRYRVGSMPFFIDDPVTGRRIEVAGHKVSCRFNPDGSVAATFGPVGEAHTHAQNEDVTQLLRVMAEQFGCIPTTAGVFGNGEKCWMLMRLADATMTPVPGDDVNGYFLLVWGHDGQVAITCMATGIRVVCANTLAVAVAGRKAWMTIRHTRSVSARLDEAAKLIEKLMISLRTTGDTFASMAAKRLNAKQIVAFIDAVIPNTDPKAATVSKVIAARRDTIAQLVHNGKGAAMANQLVNTKDGSASLWAVYNATTEYWDHVRTAEAQSPEGLRKAQESALFGGNAEAKVAALELSRQLVAA